jgi:excisionase family DNA binding protein
VKGQRQSAPILSPSPFELLNLSQAARLLNIVPSTLRAWVARGDFPAPLQLGPQTRRFRRVDIEAFLQSRGQAAGRRQGGRRA